MQTSRAAPDDAQGRIRGHGPALVVGAVAFVLYLLCNVRFDAGRGDFFYLADAFLQGRTWVDVRLGPWDVIVDGARVYVPFAPFPAIAFMPLVAVVGPVTADQWEPVINAALAATSVVLAWHVAARIGVARAVDRLWLSILLGFSTPMLWVTTRGGVWHTGHLVATLLTLLVLRELFGRRRALLIGLLAGAAFLTRPPTVFAGPVFALWAPGAEVLWERGQALADRVRRLPIRAWALMLAGVLPALGFFVLYNVARFGDPAESGYALALLPDFLARQRDVGMFSLAHVPMNLEYLFLHPPRLIAEPPFLQPDGLGMSVFITSPALLLAVRAPWGDVRARLLLAAAIAVLIPTLLYYGGGWLQYGYRYFLDSIPYVWALCALAVVRAGRLGPGWKALTLAGVLVNVLGVYWAYRI